MKRYFGRFLLIAILTIGRSVQVATEVQSGRATLMAGNTELALTHFQRGAESQPDYAFDLLPLQEGIWIWLRRAYYELEIYLK